MGMHMIFENILYHKHIEKEIVVDKIDSIEIVGLTPDKSVIIDGDTLRRVYLEDNYIFIGTNFSYEAYNLNNMKGFKVNYR